MKRFFAWLRYRLTRYFRFVYYPYRAFDFVRNMLQQGGHSINTPFVYSQHTFSFRTVIHLDGAVTNFIPNVMGYTEGRVRIDTSQDAVWLDAYKTNLYLHTQQVEGFVEAIRGNGDLLGSSVTALLSTLNVVSLGWGLWQTDEKFVLSSAALTLYTLFLRKYTSGLLIQFIWAIMRRVALGQRVLDKLLARMPKSE